MTPQANPWLHRFAWLVACATFVLIVAGAMVTSNRAGLAVPDWPTTYDHFMFSFPLSSMVGGILYEHGHRLIASTVGLLTIVLAVWLVRAEPRRWVRRLGIIALAAVIFQGILGGLTVRFFLPSVISIAHASLAQGFFCLTIALAMFTSRKWVTPSRPRESTAARTVQLLAIVTAGLVYLQVVMGATIRHSDAGVLAHVLGAVAVAICAVWLAVVASRRIAGNGFGIHAAAIAGLVAIQIGLGVVTWVVRVPKEAHGQLAPLQIVLPTIHLAVGALILGLSFALALKCCRFLTAPAAEPSVEIAAEVVTT